VLSVCPVISISIATAADSLYGLDPNGSLRETGAVKFPFGRGELLSLVVSSSFLAGITSRGECIVATASRRTPKPQQIAVSASDWLLPRSVLVKYTYCWHA
jgi:hypothetical protein